MHIFFSIILTDKKGLCGNYCCNQFIICQETVGPKGIASYNGVHIFIMSATNEELPSRWEIELEVSVLTQWYR